METTYYRPMWTCGRFHLETKSAILYNLISGKCFYFEGESAIVIGEYLSIKRKGCLNVSSIAAKTGISVLAITRFVNILCSKGLVLNQKPSPENESKYRTLMASQRTSLRLAQNDSDNTDPASLRTAEKAYAIRTNIPVTNVLIELTYNCSERCVHCYNPGATRNDSEKQSRYLWKGLHLDRYKQLIDDLYELGTARICLSGGDPFSYPFAWELIDYISRKEIALEIYTNGQSLVGKAQRLASYYPCVVGISLYSSNPVQHDSITRIPGSFDRSLSVIEDLSALSVPLQIKCCVMRPNLSSYFGVAEIALKYGARDRNMNEVACYAGKYGICITPNGTVIPCVSFHTRLGNILDDAISNILSDNPALKKLSKAFLHKYEDCDRHPYCSFCMICPGLNFSETGSMFEVNENNCYTAKVRYNLSLKMKGGYDPLGGKTLEDKLSSMGDSSMPCVKKIMSKSHLDEII